MKPTLEIPSKTTFADRILARDDLSPGARKQVARLRDEWAANPAVVARRSTACKMLDCKPTHERDLEQNGTLDSFLEGNIRLIHVSSIYEHLINRAVASHPFRALAAKRAGNIAATRAVLSEIPAE